MSYLKWRNLINNIFVTKIEMTLNLFFFSTPRLNRCSLIEHQRLLSVGEKSGFSFMVVGKIRKGKDSREVCAADNLFCGQQSWLTFFGLMIGGILSVCFLYLLTILYDHSKWLPVNDKRKHLPTLKRLTVSKLSILVFEQNVISIICCPIEYWLDFVRELW